jgi:heme iron utilization protein
VTSSYDPAALVVSSLITQAKAASLGTVGSSGAPFVSLVNIARFESRSVVMLLSGLAQHTRNLRDDSRCSLLIVGPIEPNADPLTAPRVTLSGSVVILRHDEDDRERHCLLSKHPSAAMYAGLGDFSVFRFEIVEAHLVAGFGQIRTITADKLPDE